tara:strand:- start:3 stop:785 length:783 start_codon:yes stop_codon:yes gene_type:complete
MKFQIISDIHLEYYDTLPNLKNLINISAPNLILAGDICYYEHPNFLPFFKQVSNEFENVFFVPGNHEYYAYNTIPECSFDQIDYNMKQKLSRFINVYFIQNEIIELENTIILGNTLWFRSDRTVYDPNVKLLTNQHYIKFGHKFMPTFNSVKKINNIHYNWLNNILSHIKTNKKIMVITHYLPSKKCIHKKYDKDKMNDLYFTNCEELMKFADIWISGHTHDPFIGKINNCPIFVNPKGDPRETTGYNKKLVIETYKSHL